MAIADVVLNFSLRFENSRPLHGSAGNFALKTT